MEPSEKFVELTFKAIDRSQFGNLLREQTHSLDDIKARLITMEGSVDNLCDAFNKKCSISNIANQSVNNHPVERVDVINPEAPRIPQSQAIPQHNFPPLSQLQILE